jgi:hypothetical protein
MEVLKGFEEDFVKDIKKWKLLFDSDNPHELEFPGKWEHINYFHKLPIIRTLFPDKFS